jgi:hypothetical protein
VEIDQEESRSKYVNTSASGSNSTNDKSMSRFEREDERIAIDAMRISDFHAISQCHR